MYRHQEYSVSFLEHCGVDVRVTVKMHRPNGLYQTANPNPSPLA